MEFRVAGSPDTDLLHHGTLATDGLADGNIIASGANWPSLQPAPLDATLLAAPGQATPGQAASGQAAPGAAGSSGFTNSAVTTAQGAGLVIDVTYDTSAQSYSDFAGLQAAVNTAVGYLESQFRDPITISISLGWGTLGNSGTAMPSQALGASKSEGNTFGYSTLRAALIADQTSAADATAVAALPITDPTNGKPFFVPTAQGKALGLFVGNPPGGFDGYVGLNSSQSFSFGGTPSSGQYDAVSVLEHEFTEVMGRIGSLGSYAVAGDYTALDLFRYAANGSRDLAPTASSTDYFSLNGGSLGLQFNNPVSNSGDAGDWAASAGHDAFAAATSPGVAGTVSATDLTVLDAIGYDPACFVAGTQLAGEHGPIAVERLQPGDRLRTRFAGLATVKWIGHRRIDCARHPDPGAVMPVRVAAGALGAGLPRRDLFLSPEHALAVDDTLVPVRLLLNGASIVQASVPAPVHYFHVELERHDLLFAEGVPAESYLDTGNRGLFANADAPLLLHPRPAQGQAQRVYGSCLPLLLDADRLARLWQRFAERARQLGHALPCAETTTDPALRLLVGDRTIQPIGCGPNTWRFLVPGLAEGARLVSRSAVPCALQPWRDDRRRLGVMVSGIVLHADRERLPLALDDPRLQAGWWAVEQDGSSLWRWTNGNAALPSVAACRMLELRLGEPLAYPIGSASPRPWSQAA